MAPVCGKRLSLVLTERITTPAAPSDPAAEGPCTRTPTAGRSRCHRGVRSMRLLKNTILSFDRAGRQRGQCRDVLDHHGFRFDTFTRRTDAAPKRERGHGLRRRREHGEFGFAANPVRDDDLHGAHIRESEASHFAQRPGNRGVSPGEPAERGPTSVVSDSTSCQAGGICKGALAKVFAARRDRCEKRSGACRPRSRGEQERSSEPAEFEQDFNVRMWRASDVPREWAAILGHMRIIPRVSSTSSLWPKTSNLPSCLPTSSARRGSMRSSGISAHGKWWPPASTS